MRCRWGLFPRPNDALASRWSTVNEFILNHFAEGVAGATAFRADAALVVTWHHTASAISGRADIDGGQLATYQARKRPQFLFFDHFYLTGHLADGSTGPFELCDFELRQAGF
jgi:hypothetical protein